MNLLDTFNKYKWSHVLIARIVKEMKENNESNQTFSALLSSLSLQDNGNPKQKQPVNEDIDYVYRNEEQRQSSVADSENFVLMPKIDFLGDMTPSISRKTFPPMVDMECTTDS